MSERISLLIVEDSEDDALLLANEFKRAGYEVRYERVETPASMRAALKDERWDAILSDYVMPQFSGLEAVEILKESGLDIPFILVSGKIGEDVAVEAMKAGAHNYIKKDSLARLVSALEGELRNAETRRERRRAEEAIRESEELYRALTQTSPDAVTVSDLKGIITNVSDRTVEIHGADGPEELIGKSALELIAPEDHEKALQNLQNTFEKGAVRNLEYNMVRTDGSRFIGELNAALLRDAHGNPKAFIAIARDITERKRAERELERINSELDGYAHTVSHDLKGPLSNIYGASLTLRKKIEPEHSDAMDSEVKELVGLIEVNVEKCNRHIDALLALAEAGQVPNETREVDIAGVVQEVVEENTPDITSKGIDVRYGGELGKVVADDIHIFQLFSNLISNAIRYNDNESPVVEVSYKGCDKTGAHRYRVKDNGSGIPPEELDEIFLPFVKSSNRGTGLGLAIVKKTVNLYGGEITATNDHGVCFDFTLKDIVLT